MTGVNATARLLEAIIRQARALRWLMVGLMVTVVVIDFFKPSPYSRFFWDTIPGFTAGYAFLGALVLIGVYKAIGFGLVYRSPDYYRKTDDDDGAST
ncbi:MAG: hypothetical protein RI552_00835 [Spiribacter sp.]|jgi:uncharacterized membrane protein|nr:hypothetical protein [Spiribacter sp.]MDR9454737.1 hypothetical protein [Spiribacter sp.]